MSSTSDEDDELDAAKLAALRSVAIDSFSVIQNAAAPTTSLRGRKSGGSGNGSADARGPEEGEGKDTSGLKMYQTRLQDLLYKHLDKTFGATIDDALVAPVKPCQRPSENHNVDEDGRTSGIRLFRRAPPGIVVQHREHDKTLGPRVKPKLRPSLTVDEDSEEHVVRLQAAVIDTETVEEQSKRMKEKILASAKSSQAKAELAKRKEEERVAQLKRERGEQWLPSVAAQIAKEPKLPKLAPATISVSEQASSDTPQKKKKRKKVSRAQVGVVVD